MHLGAALAPVLFMAAATPTVFGLDLPREMRAGSVPSGGEAMRLPQRYGQLPLTFEANRGQTAPEVKYLSRGRGYGLFLTPTEAVLVLEHPSARDSQRVAELSPTLGRPRGASVTYKTALRLRLEGARTEPQIVGLEEEPGKVSYLIGNDAREWRTGIPTYAKVRYRDVYPGVDLIYYGSQGQLEYDFVVAAGIDPEVITLSFEGVDGLDVDALGNLIAHVAGQQLSMRRPFIYQEYDGIRHEVAGGYRVLSNTKRLNDSGPRVAFRTGTYDASRPLVIDPVLAYSTYLGGSGQEFGQDIAVDSGGNAYVTGFTSSIDFPTVSALQSTFAGVNDAFVTKVNPAGSAAVYSTYLGGSDDDEALSIAVDASGNAYVTGFTQSVDFPTASPLQSALGGVRDAFVAKLDPTGSALVYSTYLGGSAPDVGESIALDASNNAYVTGFTDSSNFPTQNPIQGALNGTADAFVTKVNSAGSALVYSTYLGGSGEEGGFGIAVDTTGSAYVSGRTRSIDFPTVNPIQPSFAGGIDTFVTKVNSAGSALVYSTYLGGSSNDFGSGIALDPSGNAYVTGTTGSSNFPTVNPLQSTLSGAFDAFVTKVNAAGSAFVYSTYLGGSGSDGAALHGIAVDQRGNAYLTGQTDSANFPTANALQTSLGGASDGYAAKLNAAGSTLFYSTYLGGSGFDSGFSVAVDRCKGDAYLTGRTESTDFPTANPFQGALAGPRDAFVAKLAFPPQEQIQILRNQVAALVAAGVLNPGQGNALDTRLQAALNALTSGDVNTAISRLQSFINQVNALIDGNVLTRAQGQPLIDGANEVIAVLSC